MAERSFDPMLRDALLEATWREYTSAWEGAEEPSFSSNYLRWRARLLADPFAWAEKQLRPLWTKVLRTAACILLACTLTLGTLMAASPTVRATVLNWMREISGNLMMYYTDQQAKTDILPSNWRITWLPEGWELQDMTVSVWRYQGPSEKGRLTYACYVPSSADLTTNVDDVSDADAVRETIQVQGYSADYYESDGYQVLLWENKDGFLFLLRGDIFLDRETFLKIAESITYYPGPDTAYELSWIPGEYAPFSRDEMAGAAQEIWTFDKTSLTWRYITDPICSFVLPDNDPEEVTLGDFTAQYWAAEESFEVSDSVATASGDFGEEIGSSATIGDVVITVSGSPEAAQTGILLWADPVTNTTFLLEGALDRYDLIRMAESMLETSPAPSAPSHHSMLVEGTAGG